MVLKCANCGCEFKTYDKRRKFCSLSCSTTYNNKKRSTHTVEYRKKISSILRGYESEYYQNRICEVCGKPIPDGFVNKHTCSTKCGGVYRHNQKVNDWLEHPDKYDRSDRYPFIKEYLMSIHDNKCEICGWSVTNQYTGVIPLQIHHINGDSTDNRIENLQLLCPNCHTLTENYGSRNKGKSKR